MATLADEIFRFAPQGSRYQLEQDLNELHTCMRNGAWKSALILIGSLIEAVLYYHFEGNEELKQSIPKFDVRNVALTDLLQWARQHGVIDEDLYRLSEPVRDYRNTIHPRVQQRVNKTFAETTVQIAYNVLLEIVRSTNLHKETLEGQGAKALVTSAVEEVCRRTPSIADFAVYTPVIEKYGATRGGEIVRRSLRMGER